MATAAAALLATLLVALPGHAATATRTRARARTPVAHAGPRLTPAQTAFLDTLERRTFQWFWDLSDPRTGLTPDRAPTRSFASVSATGFALTAYPIGVERRWVTRGRARDRVLATLRFFVAAESAPGGAAMRTPPVVVRVH